MFCCLLDHRAKKEGMTKEGRKEKRRWPRHLPRSCGRHLGLSDTVEDGQLIPKVDDDDLSKFFFPRPIGTCSNRGAFSLAVPYQFTC